MKARNGQVVLVFALALAGSIPVLRADVVQTTQSRLEGTIAVGANHLSIGNASVAWDQVLRVERQMARPTLSAPHAVHLKSGETWYVDIARTSMKKLRFTSPLVGEREVDLTQIAAVDFLIGPEAIGNESGTLYRQVGDPVPGTLLWIDATRIALQTPLGPIILPRENTVRYAIAAIPVTRPMANEDELVLIDGSTLRGQAIVAEKGIMLRHEILGEVLVPLASIRSITRHPSSVLYLTNAVVSRQELVAPAGRDTGVALGENGIDLDAGSVARFMIPPGFAGGTFRAFVRPIDGARGEARVRVKLGPSVLAEKVLAPNDAGAVITAPVAAAGDLVVEVTMPGSPRFPCGVVLADALVVKQ